MAVPRMHDDEVTVDDDLVRRLLGEQLPDLAHLPVQRVEVWGTDHAIYRLGDDLSLRLPKIGWAAEQGEKERRWLPVLAPHLPVEIPVPVAIGTPVDGYPLPWYVAPWLDGANPAPDASDGTLDGPAQELAGFVVALQHIDPTGGPAPGTGRRGGPLADADDATRSAVTRLRTQLAGPDEHALVDALVAAWDDGLAAPPWSGAPTWLHGDLNRGNLLRRRGRLTGVIDWGSLAVGDPAVDLLPAWTYFDERSRTTYRTALAEGGAATDDATWRRGRAWAAATALHALPYYRHTNPDIVGRSWRTARAIAGEQAAR